MKKKDSLLSRFQHYVDENRLLSEDDRVLVAVSGGLDSMALLSLLVRSGYDCAIAHCNFQLRGEESDKDEKLVSEISLRYQVPFHTIKFDTKGEMAKSGESMQIVARRLRYTWFDSLLKYEKYTKMAIAHHADDSTETFFINLIRGTGLRGLTGIDVVRGDIVRPLMFATREELAQYVTENEIAYRDDASNLSTKYLRNKIRLELIPMFKEMNEHFEQTMEGNLHRLTETLAFLDISMEKIRRDCERHSKGQITINPKRIDSKLPINFVLYQLLRKYGFGGNVVDSIVVALRDDMTGKQFYARDRVAYIDRGRIVVAPIIKEEPKEYRVEAKSRSVNCCGKIRFKHLNMKDVKSVKTTEDVALIDASKLEFPLKLRRWEDGDWFIPLGMEGRKKVSDFLIDEKVSMADKERQYLLLNGDDVVWVVGRRIDDRYKLTEETKKVFEVTKS